jgi:hypothetical protein
VLKNPQLHNDMFGSYGSQTAELRYRILQNLECLPFRVPGRHSKSWNLQLPHRSQTSATKLESLVTCCSTLSTRLRAAPTPNC